MQSYLPVLKASSDRDSIASLYRGVINLQARYLLTSPYCNSFQPPAESGISPAVNGAAGGDNVSPPYDSASVFECKYELDSLAAFLEVSTNYHAATADLAFFGRFQWVAAVQAVVNAATAMMASTYDPADGRLLASPYTFTRETTRATETLANNGLGSPVAAGTGLIRSAFRPSDDSTTLQFLIPANMMFARYLASAADIVAALANSSSASSSSSKPPPDLASNMRSLASSLRTAITRYGVVADPRAGGRSIYAYEVDGFGSSLVMDDANIPSLLAAPFFGYLDADDPVYKNTRAAILDSGDAAPAATPTSCAGPSSPPLAGPTTAPATPGPWPASCASSRLTTTPRSRPSWPSSSAAPTASVSSTRVSGPSTSPTGRGNGK